MPMAKDTTDTPRAQEDAAIHLDIQIRKEHFIAHKICSPCMQMCKLLALAAAGVQLDQAAMCDHGSAYPFDDGLCKG